MKKEQVKKYAKQCAKQCGTRHAKQAVRGQVTIFFLIGIVLIVVVLLLFAARNVIVGTQNPAELSPEARQYLTQCVENTVHESLTALDGSFGQQTPTFSGNMTLGIDATNTITHYNQLGLNEPLINILGADDAFYTSDFFGTVTLQRLCDPTGPNSNVQTTNPHCGPYAYGSSSIQENLAIEIDDAVTRCLANADPDTLGNLAGFGEPTTTVTLGNQAISTNVTFSNAKAMLTQDLRARLLPLYAYAAEQLVHNTRNPISLIDDDPTSSHYREGFTITKNFIPEGYVYAFTDEQRTFAGAELTITFLVQDRPPYTDCSFIDGVCTDGLVYDPDQQ